MMLDETRLPEYDKGHAGTMHQLFGMHLPYAEHPPITNPKQENGNKDSQLPSEATKGTTAPGLSA